MRARRFLSLARTIAAEAPGESDGNQFRWRERHTGSPASIADHLTQSHLPSEANTRFSRRSYGDCRFQCPSDRTGDCRRGLSHCCLPISRIRGDPMRPGCLPFLALLLAFGAVFFSGSSRAGATGDVSVAASPRPGISVSAHMPAESNSDYVCGARVTDLTTGSDIAAPAIVATRGQAARTVNSMPEGPLSVRSNYLIGSPCARDGGKGSGPVAAHALIRTR